MNREDIDYIHSCGPDCQRPICVLVRKAVEAEREACVERAWIALVKHRQPWNVRQDVTDAIRAKGNGC